jgi:2-pyrone-4,6-dicarboxylate lactonase
MTDAGRAGAPFCLPPHPIRDLQLPSPLPAGACDCHTHVVGPHHLYRLVNDRSYTPPESAAADHAAMLVGLGFDRSVIIQPSIYGTDNRPTLDAVRASPDSLRAVVVIPPDVPMQELRRMHAEGARGFRINLLFRGGVGLEGLEATAARVAELGWHAQLLIDLRMLPDIADRVRSLPVPVVIDHMGHFPASLGTEWAGFRALLALAREGRAWIKLSGSYRLVEEGNGVAETTPIATRLIHEVPDRLVWGSDWPHVGLFKSMPGTADLLAAAIEWCGSDAVHRLFVENPAKLYGFPIPEEGRRPARAGAASPHRVPAADAE